jgi:hypothetical protein
MKYLVTYTTDSALLKSFVINYNPDVIVDARTLPAGRVF